MLASESAVQVVVDASAEIAQAATGRVAVRVEVVVRASGGGARVGDVHMAAEAAVEWLRCWRIDRERATKRASYAGVGKSAVRRSGHVTIAEAGSVGSVRHSG